MSKLIPERPAYRREQLLIGYPTLASFVLLFVFRLLGNREALSGRIWFSLLGLLAALLLPSLVFLFLRGRGYTRVLALRMPRKGHIGFLVCVFFALFSGAMLLSILFGGTSSLGNSSTAFESASANGPWATVLMWLVLAILPALLEELFFRGVMLAEYERRGAVRGVLMTALLFALCHFDIRNLPVYLFTGALLALTRFATDSLFATVILHALYNTVSLFGQRYLNALYDFTGNLELFIFLLILIFLVSTIFLCHTGMRLYRRREQEQEGEPRRAVPWEVQFYTIADALADPPILLCIALSIVGFIIL